VRGSIAVGLPDHDLSLTRFDRLDVVHAADPTAIRCGEMVEQVGHRIVRTMSAD